MAKKRPGYKSMQISTDKYKAFKRCCEYFEFTRTDMILALMQYAGLNITNLPLEKPERWDAFMDHINYMQEHDGKVKPSLKISLKRK